MDQKYIPPIWAKCKHITLYIKKKCVKEKRRDEKMYEALCDKLYKGRSGPLVLTLNFHW